MRGAESGSCSPRGLGLLTHLPENPLFPPKCALLAPRTYPCLATSSPSSERTRKRVLFVAGGACQRHGSSFTRRLLWGWCPQGQAWMRSVPAVGMVCCCVSRLAAAPRNSAIRQHLALPCFFQRVLRLLSPLIASGVLLGFLPLCSSLSQLDSLPFSAARWNHCLWNACLLLLLQAKHVSRELVF